MPRRDRAIQDLLNEFDTVYHDAELDAYVTFEPADPEAGLVDAQAVFGSQSRTFQSEQTLRTTAEQGVFTAVDAAAVRNPHDVVEAARQPSDETRWTQTDIDYAKRAVDHGVRADDVW